MFNLYNGGQTEELVNAIAEKAKEQGLALSRWQTNGAGHSTTITYALHSGERAGQFRYQSDVVDSVRLNSLEGATSRSAAYRSLSKLAKAVNL